MSNILIIDDDENIVKSIELTLKIKGYNTISTTNPTKAFNLLSNSVDAVFLDINLGSYNGKDILREIIEIQPLLPVIMISGMGSIDDAIECIQNGAFDFIQKPLSPNRLYVSLENALKYKKLKNRNILEPVFESQKMQNIINIAKKVANTDSTVLITGESGVGKDVIANYIHSISKRSENEIVKINCGAIPENLVESELFGHKKGSFTGAIADNRGKIIAAENGTLFLDEIAELPLQTQVKLLRFLENSEIQRIGEDKIIKVNSRLIAATNCNLIELIKDGKFREDLYYRLNIITLTIPPVRDRKEDIIPLIDYFNSKISNKLGIKKPKFSESALKTIVNHKLTGNVRELKNIIERSLILNSKNIIDANDIYLDEPLHNQKDTNSIFSETMSLSDAKHKLERQYLKTQLSKFQGSIKETAKALNILPNNLSRKMKQLELND